MPATQAEFLGSIGEECPDVRRTTPSADFEEGVILTLEEGGELFATTVEMYGWQIEMVGDNEEGETEILVIPE
jgi:hypothetical protein